MINISKQNKSYKYLLTVMDVFSKHAWVEPLKNKTGQAVAEVFEKIQLQTNDVNEFCNKTFQQLLNRYKIHQFFDEWRRESQCRRKI